jgi:hypothetical protein
MKELIACCGLDCEKCDARIATINNDDALREATARKWAGMNNAPEITADMITCLGCRTEGIKSGWCSMCEIRSCALGKGFETCGGCAELDSCRKVAPVLENDPEARNNLSIPKGL